MMAGSDCGCLICRLEASLLDELHHEKALEEYRRWAASSRVLAAFPTPAELSRTSTANTAMKEIPRPTKSFWSW
jgi:hypothetical protein